MYSCFVGNYTILPAIKVVDRRVHLPLPPSASNDQVTSNQRN